jgi:hypothetical protein
MKPMKTPHQCTALGLKFSLELWVHELRWMICGQNLNFNFEPICGFWIQIFWFELETNV